MDNKEFLTEKLLKAKRKGKLKPKYQAMTDEEMLEDFLSRLEEARMSRLQSSSETGQETQ